MACLAVVASAVGCPLALVSDSDDNSSMPSFDATGSPPCASGVADDERSSANLESTYAVLRC